ncbi:Uncharacterized protein Fot_23316 [Forsythia ovata]|uniref:Uncharacterized protein n=1 Tax=Forsythia ovata TaxID=205694 RepID=A0ABD1V065_9LAMI
MEEMRRGQRTVCHALNIFLTSSCLLGRGHGVGDDYYPSRRLRSVSRSVSPRDYRSYRSRDRSTRPSRSLSRSISPHNEKNHSPSSRSPSPRENGQSAPAEEYAPSRNSRSPIRSRSRSYSYRAHERTNESFKPVHPKTQRVPATAETTNPLLVFSHGRDNNKQDNKKRILDGRRSPVTRYSSHHIEVFKTDRGRPSSNLTSNRIWKD